MTGFISHFAELKKRVIIALLSFVIATIGCYFYAETILGWLIAPLAQQGADRLIYTQLTEAFVTYIKIACVAGFAIATPVIFGQIWMFIAPGLYKHEKNNLLPFFIASPLLFIIGAGLVYYFVMPTAWRFFLGFQTFATQTSLPIMLEARVSDYLNLVLSLLFAFGLCFQLPIAIALLGRIGLVTREKLRAIRRYMIILIFLVAGVLSPPDVMSQLLLAGPLMALYEISIWLIPHAPKSNIQNAN